MRTTRPVCLLTHLYGCWIAAPFCVFEFVDFHSFVRGPMFRGLGLNSESRPSSRTATCFMPTVFASTALAVHGTLRGVEVVPALDAVKVQGAAALRHLLKRLAGVHGVPHDEGAREGRRGGCKRVTGTSEGVTARVEVST